MDTKTLVTVGAVTCVGAFLVLLGADIVPQRVFKPTVPSGLLIAIGLAIILAGMSVFIRVGSPIAAARMVGVCMLFMALSFFWVAFFSDPRHMSGGIPFLPDLFNRFLGRFMFALGALFWLCLGVLALRYAKQQPEVDEDDQNDSQPFVAADRLPASCQTNHRRGPPQAYLCSVFSLTPAELSRLTGATWSDIRFERQVHGGIRLVHNIENLAHHGDGKQEGKGGNAARPRARDATTMRSTAGIPRIGNNAFRAYRKQLFAHLG